MSHTERTTAEKGRQAVRMARTNVLRDRMQAFVDEHGRSADLKELRTRVSGGSMAELVIEDREERVR